MSRLMSFVHDQVVQAGHTVDFLCSEDSPEVLRGRTARFGFPLLVLQRARAAARQGRPFDVINVHEPGGAAISLFKAAAGSPRVIVTSYGVEKRGWARLLEESSLGREKVSLKSRILYPTTLLWQARLAVTHADHVFCSNLEDFDYLTSRFQIPANKITRMHSGADAIYAEAGRTRDYSKAETLLFAGTWLKRKGTCDLVPAFSDLAARHPELRLVILNGGIPEPVVRSCFPEPARSRVFCQQAEPEEGIAAAMAATDIYLLPSLFEGTPLTLIEAMFSGMPVVTTATCGMKDVITDGETGLLAPIRSPQAIVAAVERLIGDPALRARMGQAGRSEAMEKYNWRRVAEPIQAVYERLCG
jgi:glycosyltransferase involved in cell wall biosynthesis